MIDWLDQTELRPREPPSQRGPARQYLLIFSCPHLLFSVQGSYSLVTSQHPLQPMQSVEQELGEKTQDEPVRYILCYILFDHSIQVQAILAGGWTSVTPRCSNAHVLLEFYNHTQMVHIAKYDLRACDGLRPPRRASKMMLEKPARPLLALFNRPSFSRLHYKHLGPC